MEDNNEENNHLQDQSDSSRQVQVRFITKLPPKFHLPVGTNQFTVPANLTRYGLSEVVKALLNHGDESPLFDFLIEGELLRVSLGRFLLTKGISAEKVIDVEYMLVVVPPKEKDPLLHDDWVSAVDGSYTSFIVTGSYDNVGRIWTEDGSHTLFLHGHNNAITSVTSVVSEDTNEDFLHVVTASKDRTIRLWQFHSKEVMENGKTVSSSKILKGHTAAVQTVTTNQNGKFICSGSWDGNLKIWPCTWDVDSTGLAKKRKLEDNSIQSEHVESEVEALRTLGGHTQCVSSASWFQEHSICSASWDHSVRIWNAETGNNTLTMGCGKTLNCLSVGGEAHQLIAAGGADPVLRVWDPRIPGTISPVLQLSSHKSWISACKWHPKSKFHIISASYDGTLKLWDIRSKVPLLTLEAHNEKVLCVDWWRSDCVISGGADSKMQKFSNLCIR